MTDAELKKIAKEEETRVLNILKDVGISEARMRALYPVIENTAWMKAKLDDARDAIKNTSVAIPYDNGGGQKGVRENPVFKGYEALWKSYIQGMDRILAALPAEMVQAEVEVVEKPKTMLELVRDKHKKKDA